MGCVHAKVAPAGETEPRVRLLGARAIRTDTSDGSGTTMSVSTYGDAYSATHAPRTSLVRPAGHAKGPAEESDARGVVPLRPRALQGPVDSPLSTLAGHRAIDRLKSLDEDFGWVEKGRSARARRRFRFKGGTADTPGRASSGGQLGANLA